MRTFRKFLRYSFSGLFFAASLLPLVYMLLSPGSTVRIEVIFLAMLWFAIALILGIFFAEPRCFRSGGFSSDVDDLRGTVHEAKYPNFDWATPGTAEYHLYHSINEDTF